MDTDEFNETNLQKQPDNGNAEQPEDMTHTMNHCFIITFYRKLKIR